MRLMRPSERRPRVASIHDLKSMTVLARLPDSCLEALATGSHCRSYLGREQVDLETGVDARTVIGVVEGKLQVLFQSLEGKETPVTQLCEGDVCDLGADGWAAPDVTVLTVMSPKAVVWFAAAASFQESIGEIAWVLFARCHDWLREFGGLASDGVHRPEVRICHTLWRDARYRGASSLAHTHEHLAARSCTERSKTTRVIGELQREGAIEVRHHPRRIVVLDPDRLADE
jgi:CRP-like cAMP-binding protein